MRGLLRLIRNTDPDSSVEPPPAPASSASGCSGCGLCPWPLRCARRGSCDADRFLPAPANGPFLPTAA